MLSCAISHEFSTEEYTFQTSVSPRNKQDLLFIPKVFHSWISKSSTKLILKDCETVFLFSSSSPHDSLWDLPLRFPFFLCYEFTFADRSLSSLWPHWTLISCQAASTWCRRPILYIVRWIGNLSWNLGE